MLKDISHMDEFAKNFDNFKVREVLQIQGFDLSDFFKTHMSAVNYGSSFVNNTQFK
jgi:hypothetical protein